MRRIRSKTQLKVESLEPRYLAGSMYEPTGMEQLFLELLNQVRRDPAAYGASIGLDLSGVAATQPLAFDERLIESARLHSQDMNGRDYFGHCTPITVSHPPVLPPAHDDTCDAGNVAKNPGNRINDAGYTWWAYGESIAAGLDSPSATLEQLIVDAGVSDLGHRKHLLGIDSISSTLDVVGIGLVQNGSGSFSHYTTIDSSRDFPCNINTGTCDPHDSFLTGVIYTDLDNNNFYSPGEGYNGATITATPVGGGAALMATSFASGGYSLRLPSGMYDVSVSGGGLPQTINASSVVIGSSNEKVDFCATAMAGAVCSAGSLPGDELGVSGKTWMLDTNGNLQFGGAAGGDLAVKFGKSKDVPVPFDWNGDGVDELASFKSGKTLQIDSNRNRKFDKTLDTVLLLGNGGDQVFTGVWSGTGSKQLGMLHDETGMFHLDTNGDHALGASDSQFQFTALQAGDVAVSGDWDGNGTTEIGLFRGGNTFMLDTNGNHTWEPGTDSQFTLPVTAAKPAVGDFNGDGRSDIAVFTPSTGTFQIDTNNDGTLDATHVFAVGTNPAVGNWK